MNQDWEAENILEPEVEEILFAGADFGVPPIHSVDGPEPVQALMNFLCLRPGDTDDAYFDRYNEAQLTFARDHAESLQVEVDVWFESQIVDAKPEILGADGQPIRRD